jgi:hypothetical protein
MLSNTNQRSGDDSIEQLLGSFAPGPANIDRDQLMFQAGMRAAQAAAELPSLTLRARVQTRLWPALALVSTAAAVILAIAIWQRPERVVMVQQPHIEQPAIENRLVKQSPPSPPEAIVSPEPFPNRVSTFDPALNYVQRRDLVVRDGPEALPAPAIGDAHVARTTPTQRELLKELSGAYRQQYQVDSEAWWQSWLISGDRL